MVDIKYMATVKRNTLSSQVMEMIKDHIVSNNLAPGTRLPRDRDLAQMVGCGRGAVREALKALEAIGMIEMKVGQGIFVSDCAADDILKRYSHLLLNPDYSLRELIEARIAVETWMVELATDKSTDEDIKKLDFILKKFEEQSDDEVNNIDMEFHQTLMAMADNAVVSQFSDMLVTWFSELPGGKDGRLELGRHAQIVEAIRKRDKELAKTLVRKHIENNLKMLKVNRLREPR